jgi:hypothetical protein
MQKSICKWGLSAGVSLAVLVLVVKVNLRVEIHLTLTGQSEGSLLPKSFARDVSGKGTAIQLNSKHGGNDR